MWFSAKALYTFQACFKKIKDNALFPPIYPKLMKITQKSTIKQNWEGCLEYSVIVTKNDKENWLRL